MEPLNYRERRKAKVRTWLAVILIVLFTSFVTSTSFVASNYIITGNTQILKDSLLIRNDTIVFLKSYIQDFEKNVEILDSSLQYFNRADSSLNGDNQSNVGSMVDIIGQLKSKYKNFTTGKAINNKFQYVLNWKTGFLEEKERDSLHNAIQVELDRLEDKKNELRYLDQRISDKQKQSDGKQNQDVVAKYTPLQQPDDGLAKELTRVQTEVRGVIEQMIIDFYDRDIKKDGDYYVIKNKKKKDLGKNIFNNLNTLMNACACGYNIKIHGNEFNNAEITLKGSGYRK